MPGGAVKHLHVVARVLEAATGKREYVGAVIDFTERKQTEETLRQAKAELTRISRVTTIGELAASLAHEIKQAIAAAVTDDQTCQRWLHRDQPNVAEASEASSRTVKDAMRAAEIISPGPIAVPKGPFEARVS